MISEIIIGADFVPTESNLTYFQDGNAEKLIGAGLKAVLHEHAYKIFNLEIPLTDIEDRIDKFGPNLIAPTSCIEGYRSIGVNLFTLSNNHILDQNISGLQSTMKLLDANNIAYLGAGSNIYEAGQPFVFSFGHRKIGVYACTEHEFSVAGETQPGANPFDPLYSLDLVMQLKAQTDYVIVLYHGGKEHYRYPSPKLQKNCRRLVDKGADLVVCQHSHCIGCEEKWNNGTIIYGQGNFLFDRSNADEWKTGLLIRIASNLEIDYIPVVKNGAAVRKANEAESNEIMSAFYGRTEEIKAEGFVEEKYRAYSEKELCQYLCAFQGRPGLFFRAINKLSGKRLNSLVLSCYGKKNLLQMLNYIDCEAHQELMGAGVVSGIREKSSNR